jgi:alkylation response protein AidB-like acyl-CoA dehydrogenase
MTTDWPARAKAFAEQHLAPLTDIHTLDALPDAIWQAMATEGLLGLSTPAEFGGTPIEPATQVAAVEGFVRAARNAGVGSIWQGHLHNAGFVINRLGTDEQRRRYLPALARGEIRMAVSISEPKVGAHPKHLTTRAERDGDGWRIHGEKSYLTQGPQATLIAVLAITSEENGVKRYSIFLVPKGAAGLEYVPGGNVDYLKPSSHCGLKLKGVYVGPDALLGPLGEGYELLGKPMRDHEDLVNLGSRFGAFAAELDALKEACNSDFGDHAAAFGTLIAAWDGLKALAAVALEAGPGSKRAEQLLLDIRNRSRTFQADYGALIDALGVSLLGREASLKRDLDKLGDLAGYVQKIKLERLAVGWAPRSS